MPNCPRTTLQIKTVKVYGPHYVHKLHCGSKPLYECTLDQSREDIANGSAIRVTKYLIRLTRLRQMAESADFRGESCRMGPRVMEWLIEELSAPEHEDADVYLAMFDRIHVLEITA